LAGFANNTIKVVSGSDNLTSYTTGREERFTCKVCGSKVYANLHHLNSQAIYLDMFTSPNHGPDGKIEASMKPTCHIFYTSGTVNVFDGLPKYVNLPGVFGGTDAKVEENLHK